MAVAVSEILSRAQTLIQDNTGVRWPVVELLGWLNDATREVALHKPSASSQSVVLEMNEGTRQTIPVGALMLLRVIRNLKMGSTEGSRIGGRAVRVVNRDVLDTQHPNWHDSETTPYTPSVKHFVFDESDPTAFYVFPGNDGTGTVEALVSQAPPAVTESGTDISNYEGTDVPLPDIYANAVLDYVLYRAYSKDASFAENMDRANYHMTAFANSLGLKTNSEVLSSANNSPFRITRDRVGSSNMPTGG